MSRQVLQPQQVADRRARAADGLGGLGMGQVEFTNQAIKRARLFQRIQVFALDILDKRHRNGGFVGDLANNGWHFLQDRPAVPRANGARQR